MKVTSTTTRICSLGAILHLATAVVLVAQGRPEAVEARERVTAELAAELPQSLPEGFLGVLPPALPEPDDVDPAIRESWSAALVESIQEARPDLRLVDRSQLEHVLREQKFGDSAYADPETATEVGKLVSARSLLLTEIRDFRYEGGRVRVSLEVSLVDVETGENLWTRSLQRGIVPLWVWGVVALVVLVVLVPAWHWRQRTRHRRLAGVEVPRAQAAVRLDLDGAARSITEARERAQSAGQADAARGIQEAWNRLEPSFDRVRHALPSGRLEERSSGDLSAARRAVESLSGLLSELRRQADSMDGSRSGAEALAERLDRAAGEVRSHADAVRRELL